MSKCEGFVCLWSSILRGGAAAGLGVTCDKVSKYG